MLEDKEGSSINFQVNPGRFRQEFKNMWKNLSGSKIFDFDGCRSKNVSQTWAGRTFLKKCQRDLGNSGVCEVGKILEWKNVGENDGFSKMLAGLQE